MSKLVINTLHVTLHGSNYRLPGAMVFVTNVLKTAGFNGIHRLEADGHT